MPEIIDNVRVGEYIKQILKERNMTQTELANMLHISKSAISQNLNGKSTFDIQNLIRISEIFEISLDVLLSLKSDEDRNVISEYERLVRKGIDELKEATSDKLNLDIPDLYGKVFVEYVIEYDKEDIFHYLVDNQINLYLVDHSNSKDVLLKIINYMILKKGNGFINFVHEYVKRYGSFIIDNKELEESIMVGINKYEDVEIQKRILEEEIQQKVSVLKYVRYNQQLRILTHKDWAKVIAKYHCDNLLKLLFEVSDITTYIETLLTYSIQYGYKDGLKLIVRNLIDDDIFKIKYKNELAQRLIVLVSEFNNLDIFKSYINKGIYNDVTRLLIDCIKGDKEKLFDYILLSKTKEIDYNILGINLISQNNLEIVQREKDKFSDETKDLMLSKTDESNIEMNMLLLRIGAKVNSKYYNRSTSKKVNNLFSVFMNKGESK